MRTRTQLEPHLNAPRSGSTFLASGEFSISRTDMAIRARELGFTFTRTYRSDLERSGPLGYGWTANVFERLRERTNGDVAWQQGIGRSDTFTKQPAGNYVAPAGVFMTLTKEATEFRLVSANGTVRRFDLNGRIQSITNRNGNAQEEGGRQLAAIVVMKSDLGKQIGKGKGQAGDRKKKKKDTE